MATSIAFTDTIGAATVTNGKPAPGDRFSDWTPDVDVVGPAKNALGSSDLHVFEFRSDHIAAFSLLHIPAASVDVAYRLIHHLKRGNSCTVNTGDSGLRSYTCCLAPGAKPSLKLANKQQLEYTLSLTVVNAAASPTALLCVYT